MNRVPNRFSVPLALCLAVLVGFAAVWLMQRLRGRVWAAGVFAAALGLVLLDGLSIPLPLTDARVPRGLCQIAAEPGDFAILPLPLGWRESFRTMGAEQTQIQYYQVVHGKRLLNGNASRIPDFKLAYFDRIGLIKSIVDEEMYQQVDDARRQAGPGRPPRRSPISSTCAMWSSTRLRRGGCRTRTPSRAPRSTCGRCCPWSRPSSRMA